MAYNVNVYLHEFSKKNNWAVYFRLLYLYCVCYMRYHQFYHSHHFLLHRPHFHLLHHFRLHHHFPHLLSHHYHHFQRCHHYHHFRFRKRRHNSSVTSVPTTSRRHVKSSIRSWKKRNSVGISKYILWKKSNPSEGLYDKLINMW